MEQIYNENNQNNNVRNLLIVLLVVVVGLGAFMVYHTYYKEEAESTTAAANSTSASDASAMMDKVGNWAYNNYYRLTPEFRIIVNLMGFYIIGFRLILKPLWKFGKSRSGSKGPGRIRRFFGRSKPPSSPK